METKEISYVLCDIKKAESSDDWMKVIQLIEKYHLFLDMYLMDTFMKYCEYTECKTELAFRIIDLKRKLLFNDKYKIFQYKNIHHILTLSYKFIPDKSEEEIKLLKRLFEENGVDLPVSVVHRMESMSKQLHAS